jgi:3-isopropylmalate/(R)-2-methylmalate dehydratase large subunit
VEHVLATQTITQKKSKAMLVKCEGALPPGVTPKDLVLAIIGKIGTAGGTGHSIEFGGSTIRAMSMEGRMTVCNMAIEAGSRAGMVAVDEKTIDYLRGRPYAPAGEMFDKAAAYWKTLVSDPGAKFDKVVEIDSTKLVPQVTWGTSPEMVTSVEGRVPGSREGEGPGEARGDGTRAHVHGTRAQHGDRPTSRWTRSSSARAPTRESRTCAPPRPWCAASASRRT